MNRKESHKLYPHLVFFSLVFIGFIINCAPQEKGCIIAIPFITDELHDYQDVPDAPILSTDSKYSTGQHPSHYYDYDGIIRLYWTEPEGVEFYYLYRSQHHDLLFKDLIYQGNESSFTDKVPSSSFPYVYFVQAHNSSGYSQSDIIRLYVTTIFSTQGIMIIGVSIVSIILIIAGINVSWKKGRMSRKPPLAGENRNAKGRFLK